MNVAVLRWHHTVTVGATQRIPFVCEKCHACADAVVSVKSAGFASSGERDDPRAVQRAELQARKGVGVAIPRLAELAACPQCGFRSEKALAAARGRGLKLALGGLATLAVGAALTFGLGGAIGWSIGGFVLLAGLMLTPAGLLGKRLSISAADKSVRFEHPQ